MGSEKVGQNAGLAGRGESEPGQRGPRVCVELTEAAVCECDQMCTEWKPADLHSTRVDNRVPAPESVAEHILPNDTEVLLLSFFKEVKAISRTETK